MSTQPQAAHHHGPSLTKRLPLILLALAVAIIALAGWAKPQPAIGPAKLTVTEINADWIQWELKNETDQPLAYSSFLWSPSVWTENLSPDRSEPEVALVLRCGVSRGSQRLATGASIDGRLKRPSEAGPTRLGIDTRPWNRHPNVLLHWVYWLNKVPFVQIQLPSKPTLPWIQTHSAPFNLETPQ